MGLRFRKRQKVSHTTKGVTMCIPRKISDLARGLFAKYHLYNSVPEALISYRWVD